MSSTDYEYTYGWVSRASKEAITGHVLGLRKELKRSSDRIVELETENEKLIAMNIKRLHSAHWNPPQEPNDE